MLTHMQYVDTRSRYSLSTRIGVSACCEKVWRSDAKNGQPVGGELVRRVSRFQGAGLPTSRAHSYQDMVLQFLMHLHLDHTRGNSPDGCTTPTSSRILDFGYGNDALCRLIASHEAFPLSLLESNPARHPFPERTSWSDPCKIP